jgi:hypothetical protein
MKPSALSEPDLLGSLCCYYGPRQRQAERHAADTGIALADMPLAGVPTAPPAGNPPRTGLDAAAAILLRGVALA